MEIVWKMHDSYGRMARILIERGKVHASTEAFSHLHHHAEGALLQQLSGRTKLRMSQSSC